MKKLNAILSASLLALSLGATTVAGTQQAKADDYRCNGTISNRTIDGNVVVPANGYCQIFGSTIKGNITTGRNAGLNVNGSRVDGNIEGFNNRWFTIVNNRVDGNVISKNARNGALVRTTTVDGNIEMFSNNGTVRVMRNTVDGNIVCKSNRSTVTGTLNRVDGDTENQCRNLKQVSWLTPASGAPRASKDGRVYVYGHLSVWDTWGNQSRLSNQRVLIQTRASGGRWVTRATTRPTNSNGYWISSIPNLRGHDVRVVFDSPFSSITDAYRGVGKIA